MDKKKILIASHERSGTHFLINTIAENFGYSPNQVDIDHAHGYSLNNHQASKDLFSTYKNQNTALIFKSHHSYPIIEYLMSEILDEFHIFYIVRDGRDVMTSFWRYLNSLAPGWGPGSDSIGDFMKASPFGGILQYQHSKSPTMLQRWIDHTKSWERANNNVNFISYEELYTDFDTTVTRISNILNQKVSDIHRPGLDSPSSLPWKGVIGNWKDHFTDADTEYFDAWTEGLDVHTYQQK